MEPPKAQTPSGTVAAAPCAGGVRGNRAIGNQGKEHSLTTVKPVAQDARSEPIAVRLRGSAQTDARQRASLNPFAEQLREFIANRGDARLTLGDAAAWLKTGGRKARLEAAMRDVRSFSAFLNLFPEIFDLDIPAAGGTTRVRLLCLCGRALLLPPRLHSL